MGACCVFFTRWPWGSQGEKALIWAAGQSKRRDSTDLVFWYWRLSASDSFWVGGVPRVRMAMRDSKYADQPETYSLTTSSVFAFCGSVNDKLSKRANAAFNFC